MLLLCNATIPTESFMEAHTIDRCTVSHHDVSLHTLSTAYASTLSSSRWYGRGRSSNNIRYPIYIHHHHATFINDAYMPL